MADNKRGRGDRDENQENPNECKSAKAIKLSTFFFPTFDTDKFGKIHRHHWKERLKVESDLLKANEDTAP